MGNANSIKSRTEEMLGAFVDRREFILVSPMNIWATPCWNGTFIHVPPVDEIVRTPPGTTRYFESAKDPVTGEWIPGTLHVWDLFESSPLGERKAYDITLALREALGITRDPKSGRFTYEKEWGAAGIGVVLVGASLAEIEEVRDQGRERWKEHSQATAQMRVHAHESMNAARIRNGLAPFPDTSEVEEAREIISLLSQDKRKKLLQRFDLLPPQGAAADARRDLGRGTVVRIPAKKGDEGVPVEGTPAP